MLTSRATRSIWMATCILLAMAPRAFADSRGLAAVCGDGIVDPGEECDDGNDSNADACGTDCNAIVCGDGVVEAGEECDDGNRADEDGCSPFCTRRVGPYGVGLTFVRFTYFSEPFGTDRQIDARVWYPAATPPPPGTPVDFAPENIPAAKGVFPLLLESHGFGAPNFTSLRYDPGAYFLARNGYIVAAPFHPGDDLAVFGYVLAARPQDLRLLLDHLLDPKTVPEVLRGHIERDRIGALGQSLGGITATATAVNGFIGSVRDPRIKAVLGTGSENYVFLPEMLATSRVPITLLIGDRDTYFGGSAAIRDLYRRHQPPRFLVEITGGDHGTPLNAGGCALPYCSHRGALRYPLAFFGTYLRNDRSQLPLLQAGAETEFGEVHYFRDPGPALVMGGKSRRDCMVALGLDRVDGLDDTPLRAVRCVDGSDCDRDSEPGHCTFDLRLCVNAVDRRVVRCEPTDVASLLVRRAPSTATLQALQEAATAIGPTSDRRCSEPVTLTVPVGAKGRIKVRAVDSAGRSDTDTYVLRCRRSR